MNAEYCGQPADGELLGAGLLALAGVTVQPLALSQLLPLHVLLQAGVEVAHGGLLALFGLARRACEYLWNSH